MFVEGVDSVAVRGAMELLAFPAQFVLLLFMSVVVGKLVGLYGVVFVTNTTHVRLTVVDKSSGFFNVIM